MMQQITPTALAKRLADPDDNVLLLDVRTEQEREICHIADSLHIPMNLVPLQMNQLPDEQDIVIYCHHGIRSQAVANYLLEAGFEPQRLFNLDGGIERWAQEIEPDMPRY